MLKDMVQLCDGTSRLKFDNSFSLLMLSPSIKTSFVSEKCKKGQMQIFWTIKIVGHLSLFQLSPSINARLLVRTRWSRIYFSSKYKRNSIRSSRWAEALVTRAYYFIDNNKKLGFFQYNRIKYRWPSLSPTYQREYPSFFLNPSKKLHH